MESILWMDMLAYPQNLLDNLQSVKHKDMLAYPNLWEFSLNHNYLQSVLSRGGLVKSFYDLQSNIQPTCVMY